MTERYFPQGPNDPILALLGFATGTLPNGEVVLLIEFGDPRPGGTKTIVRVSMKRTIATEMSSDLAIPARAPHVEPPARSN